MPVQDGGWRLGDTNERQHTRCKRLQKPHMLGHKLCRLSFRQVAYHSRGMEHAMEGTECHGGRPESLPQSASSAKALASGATTRGRIRTLFPKAGSRQQQSYALGQRQSIKRSCTCVTRYSFFKRDNACPRSNTKGSFSCVATNSSVIVSILSSYLATPSLQPDCSPIHRFAVVASSAVRTSLQYV